jgi:hypothetical protein
VTSARERERELSRFAENVADVMRSLSASHWPVHLSSVARRLGVSSIVYSAMIEDGKTWWDGPQVHVRLRQGRGQQRQRFTLAHELAHVALSRPQSGPYHRAPFASSEEERLCDLVAGALLLPADRVRADFAAGPVTLQALRAHSDAAMVSLAACVLRINQLTRRQLCLIAAERRDDRWEINRTTGVGRAAQSRLRITEQDIDGLSRAGDSHPTAVRLDVGGRPHATNAYVRYRYGRLLMLLPGLPPGFHDPRSRFP